MISVVVPAYNEERTIGACIEALLSQEGLSAAWEIIIVDDGSTDATGEIARGFAERDNGEVRVNVISLPNRGASAARNAGAAAATGDVLLFTDADCRPTPRWAAELAARLDAGPDAGSVAGPDAGPDVELDAGLDAGRVAGPDVGLDDGPDAGLDTGPDAGVNHGLDAGPKVAAVMGLQRSDQESLVARFVQAEYDEKHEHLLSRAAVTFADTATAGFRVDAFRESGGFDESLQRFEDTELAFRMAADGHLLVVEPRAIVMHDHVTSVAQYARRKLRLGYWGSAVYGRHREMVADDSRTPWTMRAQMVLAPTFVASLLLAATASGLRLHRLADVMRLGAGVSAGTFLVSTVPFMRYALARGPAVALLAPLMLFVRAIALTTGLVLGLVRRGRASD